MSAPAGGNDDEYRYRSFEGKSGTSEKKKLKERDRRKRLTEAFDELSALLERIKTPGTKMMEPQHLDHKQNESHGKQNLNLHNASKSLSDIGESADSKRQRTASSMAVSGASRAAVPKRGAPQGSAPSEVPPETRTRLDLIEQALSTIRNLRRENEGLRSRITVASRSTKPAAAAWPQHDSSIMKSSQPQGASQSYQQGIRVTRRATIDLSHSYGTRSTASHEYNGEKATSDAKPLIRITNYRQKSTSPKEDIDNSKANVHDYYPHCFGGYVPTVAGPYHDHQAYNYWWGHKRMSSSRRSREALQEPTEEMIQRQVRGRPSSLARGRKTGSPDATSKVSPHRHSYGSYQQSPTFSLQRRRTRNANEAVILTEPRNCQPADHLSRRHVPKRSGRSSLVRQQDNDSSISMPCPAQEDDRGLSSPDVQRVGPGANYHPTWDAGRYHHDSTNNPYWGYNSSHGILNFHPQPNYNQHPRRSLQPPVDKFYSMRRNPPATFSPQASVSPVPLTQGGVQRPSRKASGITTPATKGDSSKPSALLKAGSESKPNVRQSQGQNSAESRVKAFYNKGDVKRGMQIRHRLRTSEEEEVSRRDGGAEELQYFRDSEDDTTPDGYMEFLPPHTSQLSSSWSLNGLASSEDPHHELETESNNSDLLAERKQESLMQSARDNVTTKQSDSEYGDWQTFTPHRDVVHASPSNRHFDESETPSEEKDRLLRASIGDNYDDITLQIASHLQGEGEDESSDDRQNTPSHRV